jgi:predicted enzyme related to lactoylglutathione lyase
MKLKKIDNIMFYVEDLEKAADFYEEVLGLERVWKDEKRKMIGFIFEEDDSEIVIHNDTSLPNPDFNFLVDDVEEFIKEFKEKGHSVVMDPFEIRSGMCAVIEDTDGNKLPIVDLTKFNNQPRYN